MAFVTIVEVTTTQRTYEIPDVFADFEMASMSVLGEEAVAYVDTNEVEPVHETTHTRRAWTRLAAEQIA